MGKFKGLDIERQERKAERLRISSIRQLYLFIIGLERKSPLYLAKKIYDAGWRKQ